MQITYRHAIAPFVEALTVLVFVAAFLTALVVNAAMQRRFLASGEGFIWSSAKSGLLGFLSAISIIGTYLLIGNLIWRLFG